ncbi:MAG: ester cyclase [Clostridiales bacterium]|nr:ester cyclase [Clostridiales bacterium]
MTIEEMKRIKTLLFRAANEKEGSLIEPYLADKIIWHDSSDVVFEWPKKDFINGNVLGIGSFPRTKDIVLQMAEYDKVYTLFTIDGNHTVGNCMGYPPTGKHIRYNAQYTARFENGLIVEMWATMDGHLVLKQLGVIE